MASDYFPFRGRLVPREVAEEALGLFDRAVGLDHVLAKAASADGDSSMESMRSADETLPRSQAPITLERIGKPTAEEQLSAERRAPALRRAQELVAQHVSSDRSLVEELMLERRAESARE